MPITLRHEAKPASANIASTSARAAWRSRGTYQLSVKMNRSRGMPISSSARIVYSCGMRCITGRMRRRDVQNRPPAAYRYRNDRPPGRSTRASSRTPCSMSAVWCSTPLHQTKSNAPSG